MNTVCLTRWPCPSEIGPTYIYIQEFALRNQIPPWDLMMIFNDLMMMLLNIVKKSMKGPVKIFFGQSKIHVRY